MVLPLAAFYRAFLCSVASTRCVAFLQAEPAQAVVETDPGLYWAQASRRRQRKKSGRRRQTDADSRGAAAGKKGEK